MDPIQIIQKIRSVLSPDLLKRDYPPDSTNPTKGHCYAASEALYHLLGGPPSGWFPVRGRDGDGIVHWWLQNRHGEVLDPTADQYLSVNKEPPYANGVPGGFLTREPSKRARDIMGRVQKRDTDPTIIVRETPLKKRYRLSCGLTDIYSVDGAAFKNRWEKTHPTETLDWSPARLDNLKDLWVLDAYPQVSYSDVNGLDVGDGRHRITLAANRGCRIEIAVPPQTQLPADLTPKKINGSLPLAEEVINTVRLINNKS